MLTIIRGRIIIFSKDRLWFLFFPPNNNLFFTGHRVVEIKQKRDADFRRDRTMCFSGSGNKIKGAGFLQLHWRRKLFIHFHLFFIYMSDCNLKKVLVGTLFKPLRHGCQHFANWLFLLSEKPPFTVVVHHTVHSPRVLILLWLSYSSFLRGRLFFALTFKVILASSSWRSMMPCTRLRKSLQVGQAQGMNSKHQNKEETKKRKATGKHLNRRLTEEKTEVIRMTTFIWPQLTQQ